MAQAFAEIAFTPAVKAAQERHGSRASYARLETPDAPRRDQLTAKEARFIEARDGFYMATVGADGWPYVQFRGGAPGFAKVIDGKTFGWADVRGNRQYLSVGNLAGNDRVAFIFMDYAHRRRLKVWGRARVVEAMDDPEPARILAVEGYPAVVERAVLVHVDALDWNCPQHITPRFTLDEFAALNAATAADPG